VKSCIYLEYYAGACFAAYAMKKTLSVAIVNLRAVNQPGFNVFTASTRSVLYMKHAVTGLPVAFVAIGALLVGSIKWTDGGNQGSTVKRGEELGYACHAISSAVAHRFR
jgi:phosphatidylserine decarboxylase